MRPAARPVLRVSAYAVCTDADRRLLLCRIAPGFTTGYEGWWTLPGGGIEHGEDPREAAIRELAEETGLAGEDVELLEVDSWHAPYTDRSGEAIDYHGIRVLYRCRLTGGELRAERGGSTDAVRWFDAEALAAERIVDIAALAAGRLGLVG